MGKAADIVVCSLTTPDSVLVHAISESPDDRSEVLCLSPHKMFDSEIAEIQALTRRRLSFMSFHEFINQEEMEFCDQEADRIIVNQYGSRARRLRTYYAKIKEIKNQIILRNLKKHAEPAKKYVLADDLGIDATVWIADGFDPQYLRAQGFAGGTIAQCRRIIASAAHAFQSTRRIAMLSTAEETYLFVGNLARVRQYLDEDKVSFKDIATLQRLLLVLMFNTCGLMSNAWPARIARGALLTILMGLYRIVPEANRRLPILSPMHEDADWLGLFAKTIGVDMIYMQDGFLPSYYPSAYLKYRIWATNFFIWDRLSAGIFERHSLPCKLWPCFRPTSLQRIEESAFTVRNVVVLTSGSGDWTALKNRSDEDLAFLAFIEVARKLPDVQIIYRPHPLWMHPEHQGTESIRRVAKHAAAVDLPNFTVSSGALQEGDQFTKDGQVSVTPTTIKREMEEADIIFGDHSQSLLKAGQQGKIFASVSMAKRTEFLYDYTNLGFPILRSSDDIVRFIKSLETSTETIQSYNSAVDTYNQQYAQ